MDIEIFRNGNFRWNSLQTINDRAFTCGHCGDKVASDRGYGVLNKNNIIVAGVYICPNCKLPNFVTPDGDWLPGQPFGRSVKNVPEPLHNLYEESRKCAKNNCYTATVLLCRKMLMNIAVEQGAEENLRFIEYVNFLADKGYVPPNGRRWIDHIRKKGNEATHEIHMMTIDDAKDLLFFTEMLLIFLYEFPAMIPE